MTDIALRLMEWGGYWGIALLMCLENVVPPIPSELIMGLGGINVAHGRMALVPLVAAGTAGTVVGNYFWYWIGYRLGYERLRGFVDRRGRWLTLDWSDVERLNAFFRKYGGVLVFAFRILPTFRTMISLPAGLVRMSHWRFLLWTAAGSAIWNTILAEAGLLLGQHFGDLEHYVGPVAVAMSALIAVVYLYRVATWRPKH